MDGDNTTGTLVTLLEDHYGLSIAQATSVRLFIDLLTEEASYKNEQLKATWLANQKFKTVKYVNQAHKALKAREWEKPVKTKGPASKKRKVAEAQLDPVVIQDDVSTEVDEALVLDDQQ